MKQNSKINIIKKILKNNKFPIKKTIGEVLTLMILILI